MFGDFTTLCMKGLRNGNTWFFPLKTWSVNDEWRWETTACPCANTSNFQLGGAKTFLGKFCWRYQSFMWKLQPVLEILKFSVYATLPPLDEGLRKTRIFFSILYLTLIEIISTIYNFIYIVLITFAIETN